MGIREPEKASFGGHARLVAYALISLATVILSISILPQNAFAASVSSASVSGFSSYPSGYILLNQPIEYSVTRPLPVATDTYTIPARTISRQVWVPSGYNEPVPYVASKQVWVNTSHWDNHVPYTAYHNVWINSGYERYNVPYTAYHNVWINSGYERYNVPYTAYHNVWVKSGYWQPYVYYYIKTYGYWSYRRISISVRWGFGWPNIGVSYWGCQQIGSSYHFRSNYYSCWTRGSYHTTIDHYRGYGRRWVNTSHWDYHVPYTAYHNIWVNTSHWDNNVPYTAYHNIWVNTSHWDNNVPYTAYHNVWVTSGYSKTVSYTAYNNVWVNTSHWETINTTIPAHTATAIGRLVGIQPGIQDTTQGQYYNETYYGSMCTTSTTPLISPASPAFPNYSGQVWRYTTFFESNNICTFNPTFTPGNNVQSWLLANNQARLTFTPEYSFDINGATQVIGGQTLYGPSWSLNSISSSTCSIINQYTYCPGQPRVKTPTG